MLKVLLLIYGLFFSICLKAQEWFPIGASWYYNQIELLVGESYLYFEVTGETMVQGHNCKIITGQCNCTYGGIGTYLYEDGDKVFVFDGEADSFKLLYDFNLLAGDTLIFQGDSLLVEDGKYLIDSITLMQVGSDTLRVQHITHLAFDLVWGDKIIERIGSNGCLYPQVSFCDPLTGGLRCYEDNETGLVNFQIPSRPCNFVTGINNLTILPKMNVYPNPSSGNVNIQSEKPIDQIIVFNNLSVPVYHKSSIFNTDLELDMMSFPEGIYHLQAILTDHQMIHRSLVIQK